MTTECKKKSWENIITKQQYETFIITFLTFIIINFSLSWNYTKTNFIKQLKEKWKKHLFQTTCFPISLFLLFIKIYVDLHPLLSVCLSVLCPGLLCFPCAHPPQKKDKYNSENILLPAKLLLLLPFASVWLQRLIINLTIITACVPFLLIIFHQPAADKENSEHNQQTACEQPTWGEMRRLCIVVNTPTPTHTKGARGRKGEKERERERGEKKISASLNCQKVMQC